MPTVPYTGIYDEIRRDTEIERERRRRAEMERRDIEVAQRSDIARKAALREMMAVRDFMAAGATAQPAVIDSIPVPRPLAGAHAASPERRAAILKALESNGQSFPELQDGEGYIEMDPVDQIRRGVGRSASAMRNLLFGQGSDTAASAPAGYGASITLDAPAPYGRSAAAGVPQEWINAEASGNVPPGTFSREDRRVPIRSFHTVDQEVSSSDPMQRFQMFSDLSAAAARRGDVHRASLYGRLAEQNANVGVSREEQAFKREALESRNATAIEEATIRANRPYATRGAVPAGAVDQLDPISAQLRKDWIAGKVRSGVSAQEAEAMADLGMDVESGKWRFLPGMASKASAPAVTEFDQLKLATDMLANKHAYDDATRATIEGRLPELTKRVFERRGGASPLSQALNSVLADDEEDAASTSPLADEITLDGASFSLRDRNGNPYTGLLRSGVTQLMGPDGVPFLFSPDVIRAIQDGDFDISNFTVVR